MGYFAWGYFVVTASYSGLPIFAVLDSCGPLDISAVLSILSILFYNIKYKISNKLIQKSVKFTKRARSYGQIGFNIGIWFGPQMSERQKSGNPYSGSYSYLILVLPIISALSYSYSYHTIARSYFILVIRLEY